jgi:hypothetical protein
MATGLKRQYGKGICISSPSDARREEAADSKGLPRSVTPFDSALTKNRGGVGWTNYFNGQYGGM